MLTVVLRKRSGYLKGHVGNVHELVTGESQHVEEAQLREGSRLDLLHAVVIQVQLLQGGQPIEGLLQRPGQVGFKIITKPSLSF